MKWIDELLAAIADEIRGQPKVGNRAMRRTKKRLDGRMRGDARYFGGVEANKKKEEERRLAGKGAR